MSSKQWKIRLKRKDCKNFFQYQSSKLYRFKAKLWREEVVCVSQFSFVRNIRFSQKLMQFYGQEYLSKIKVIYLQ